MAFSSLFTDNHHAVSGRPRSTASHPLALERVFGDLADSKLTDEPAVVLHAVDALQDPFPEDDAWERDLAMRELVRSAPLAVIRRAALELATGDLDARLVYNSLLGVDQNSAEFRERYIQLRVAQHKSKTTRNDYRVNRQPLRFVAMSLENDSEPQVPDAAGGVPSTAVTPFKNPWCVDSMRDFVAFFGLWTTVTVIIQVAAAVLIGRILLGRPELELNLGIREITLILIGAFVVIDLLVLVRLRGRDFHAFIPWIIGLFTGSSVVAIGAFLLHTLVKL